MKRILNFSKKFPLTSYALLVSTAVFIFVAFGSKQKDDLSILDPVFWLFIFSIPLNVLSRICHIFGLKYSILYSVPVCVSVDMLFIYISARIKIKRKSIKV